MKKSLTSFLIKSLFLLALLTIAASSNLASNFTLEGNATYSQLGGVVSSGGDIDQDGYDDIIIGTLSASFVYVVYGGSTTNLDSLDLSSTPLDPSTTGFTITGNVTIDFLASSLNIAGDINNDGYNDIVIGSHVSSVVYVIYGRPRSMMSNIDLSTMTLDPASTGFMLQGNNLFGCSVSTGDVNNDDYDDIIIGARADSETRGAVYVIYGRPTSSMQNFNVSLIPELLLTVGFSIIGESEGDFLGFSVSAGDVNADGYDDIIMGAPWKNNSAGAVYVVYGRTNLTNINLSNLLPTEGFKIFGESGSSAGKSISVTDIDGDGLADVVIGGDNSVFVVYGQFSQPDILLSSQVLDPATTGLKIQATGGFTAFGLIVSSAGDLKNDGYEGIIIGASARNNEGTVYVIYGGPRSNLTNLDLLTSVSPSQAFVINGSYYSFFGFSVCSGDVNNDGMPDLIIGAIGWNGYRGAVYVLSYEKLPCPINCNNCIRSICNDCFSGFTLQNSVCTACPANCNGCSDPSVCQVCSDPFLLYQGQCVTNCPSQTVEDSGACQNCPDGCDVCTDPAVCRVCSDPFLLYQGQCVTNCPAGTTPSNGSCISVHRCSSNCYMCDNSTSTCNGCFYPYLLYQGQCLSSCPAKTASIDGFCFDCSSGCETCFTPGFCSACSDSYFFSQGQCVTNCPSQTVAVNGACQNCPDGCDVCTDPSYCQACSWQFLSYQGQCVQFCPANTTESNGACISVGSCSSNCQVCDNSTSSCQVCSYPYFLYQGQCISSCPTSTVATNGTCENCPDNCEVCSSPTSCQVYASPNQGGQIITNSSTDKLSSEGGEITSGGKSAARIFAGTSLAWALWFLLSLLL